MSQSLISEIERELRTLSDRALMDLRRFIDYLRVREATDKPPLDEGSAWSDEDIRDLAAACSAYASKQEPWQDEEAPSNKEHISLRE